MSQPSSVLLEESRHFLSCLQDATDKGVVDANSMCTQSMVENDCDRLGPICDLPQEYLAMMSMGHNDQEAIKSNFHCSKACNNSI